jgi:hypothetical protein
MFRVAESTWIQVPVHLQYSVISARIVESTATITSIKRKSLYHVVHSFDLRVVFLPVINGLFDSIKQRK